MREAELQPINQIQPNFIFARTTPVHYSYVIVDGILKLKDIDGEIFELMLDVHAVKAEEFRIILRGTEDLSAGITLSYQTSTRIITLTDGTFLKQVQLNKDLKDIHIFANLQSIQVYLNKGDKECESYVHNLIGGNQIQFESIGGLVLLTKITKWELKA